MAISSGRHSLTLPYPHGTNRCLFQCSRDPYHTELSAVDKRLLAFLHPQLEWEPGLIHLCCLTTIEVQRESLLKKGRESRKTEVGLGQWLARTLPFSYFREAIMVSLSPLWKTAHLEPSSPASTSETYYRSLSAKGKQNLQRKQNPGSGWARPGFAQSDRKHEAQGFPAGSPSQVRREAKEHDLRSVRSND